MTPVPVPAATYRLRNASFTFEAATALVDYLDALGVSHCDASSHLAWIRARVENERAVSGVAE